MAGSDTPSECVLLSDPSVGLPLGMNQDDSERLVNNITGE